MINSNHISQLLNSPWAISSGALESFILSAITQHKNGIKAEMPVPFRMNAKNEIGNGSKKEVLIVPIEGVIVKYDMPEAGLIGLKSIQNLINKVNADSTLVGAVLYHESPGGTVMDLAETADIIHNSIKPIVSFVELSCSASYYLAAASRYIIATKRSAMVANIGTRTSPMDMRGILGKLGAKYADVFGTLAFDKDLGFADAIDGKPEKMQQLLIDPHNEMFVNDVKKYRPQVQETATHGAVYLSEAGISEGLIDQVGIINDAVSKVFELSETKSKPQNNSQNKISNMSQIFKTVAAALGFPITAKADNSEHTEEEYASAIATGINQKLTGFEETLNAYKSENSQNKEKIENLSTQLGNANKAVKDVETANSNLKSELDSLKSKVPGANATTSEQDKEDKAPESGQKWTPIV
jgi:ClpP class serine protease